MSFPRVSLPILSLALVMALLASLLPLASLVAADADKRLYMVTLDVSGSGRVIAPSSKQARGRIAARAERAEQVGERLRKEHGVRLKHRFGKAVTGFSARMTATQARRMAQDGKVVNVRPARRATFAAQSVEVGVERVKAVYDGSGTDVNAHVAVIDTGIGPSEVDVFGFETGVPISMSNQGPQNKPELNIAGGVNCHDDTGSGRWADTHGHGTHVAGVIGARDNSVGTVGVAPGVKLWSVRVFQGQFGTEANVVCGLDWVIGRNTDGNPNNDIDVINMSLEIERIDTEEDCTVVLNDPGGDPVQKGVCQAVALGVTVVAAAGNSRRNANLWAPAGYDNVITVGAMTDTDGDGWAAGGNATCAGYTSQKDDTYATGYSNWGRDVDIVAPGTCVRSTRPTVSGASTIRMTGTSMAAPHVAGAAARYLASNPGTTPKRMRRLVRASGQMDWNAATDPVWSGPSDLDLPNRVLDVRWLVGSNRIKTWLHHSALSVAGSATARRTRVDVQRGGGYADTVTLTKSGLPAGASATFVHKTLDGLDPEDLGTNLDFDFPLDTAQGHFDVTVTSKGADVDPYPRVIDLTVDRVGPAVSGLNPRVRQVTMQKNGTVQVKLGWQVADLYSGIAHAKLQRKTGSSSAYSNVGGGGLTGAKVYLKRGQKNRFRVKTQDSLGNNRWSSSISARLSVRDSGSTLWQRPSAWKQLPVSQAYGGSILLAKGATASLLSNFSGRAAAIVASVGPGRGTFKVRVDGGSWQHVSLKTSSAQHRKVVWSEVLNKGGHTIEIQGVSGQSTFDALLSIR